MAKAGLVWETLESYLLHPDLVISRGPSPPRLPCHPALKARGDPPPAAEELVAQFFSPPQKGTHTHSSCPSQVRVGKPLK